MPSTAVNTDKSNNLNEAIRLALSATQDAIGYALAEGKVDIVGGLEQVKEQLEYVASFT